MFISLLFKLRKFSTYFEYSNNEIICKFVGKIIAKRHATILERLNFHLPSLSLSSFPCSFSYPSLSLLFAVMSLSLRSLSLSFPHNSYALSPLLFYPLTKLVSCTHARTQYRSRECTLNFGGPGTYSTMFYDGVISERGIRKFSLDRVINSFRLESLVYSL